MLVHMWMDREQPIKLVQRTPPPAQKTKQFLALVPGVVNWMSCFWILPLVIPTAEQMWAFYHQPVGVSASDGAQGVSLDLGQCALAYLQTDQTMDRLVQPGSPNTRGDVRLLVFWLPTKSPWLNPIEPHWGHAKKHVCEPSGELEAHELKRRYLRLF